MTSLEKTSKWQTAVNRFHKDERGMQSIETVVILAMAAVVVVGIFWLWNTADVGGSEGGIKGAVATLLEKTFTSATAQITTWFG